MLPLGETDDVGDWPRIRELAEVAEAEGLDSLWVADHFFHKTPDEEPKGLHEAWTLMSAVAAVTSRVELAPLVLCSAFRSPGLLANMAATLDVVSQGRLVLGVGAGWHDPEFEAFGYPTDHKVSRFEEWIEIVVRLLRGDVLRDPRRPRRPVAEAAHPDPDRRQQAADDAARRAPRRLLEHGLVRSAGRQAPRTARRPRHRSGRGGARAEHPGANGRPARARPRPAEQRRGRGLVLGQRRGARLAAGRARGAGPQPRDGHPRAA